MQTIWQSQGKVTTCLVLLLVSLSLYPRATSAQSTPKTSMCARENAPLNPKTNKPYTPDELKQEPFVASITKDEMPQCLKEGKPITNHHIVFEDLVWAWKEAVALKAQDVLRQKGIESPNGEQIDHEKKWDIPINLYGGVLHAKTDVDGISLWKFRDPTTTDASRLTENERRTFGITKQDFSFVIIRPEIRWEKVFIDAVVSTGQKEILTIFSNKATFNFTTFSKQATFILSIFSDEVDFLACIFSKKADFNSIKFRNKSDFNYTKFNNEVSFSSTTFSDKTYFFHTNFNDQSYFSVTIFSDLVIFSFAIFSKPSYFSFTTFSKQAYFDSAIFSNEANFDYAIFKSDADFRDMRADATLSFDNTTWEGRVDLRGMSAKALHWDSRQHPSEVKGIFDLREATIGRATFNEVRFQDVVDFSRTTFGAYKAGMLLLPSWTFRPSIQVLGPLSREPVQLQRLWTMIFHPSPFTYFVNNTFAREADFLHVTFGGSALLINNRFRSTLDLTGATFAAHNAGTSPAQDTQPRLCLSYNRIHRLVLGLEHLGNPPSVSPYELLIAKPLGSPFANPLQTSRVRQVVEREGGPEGALTCDFADTTTSNTKNANANRYEEHLDDIYKTIGQSFREANNQGGVNEAWYLQKVVEQNHQRPVWRWLSRVFLDIPSRYAVDVWRTVWISLVIMLGFYVLYMGLLWRLARDHHTLQGPEYAPRQRAFRIRLFEPLHRNSIRRTRRIKPWWDALALSFRAFTKIGFGTAYPNTWGLKVLTSIEWVLGVYMLIHFILAVKNNLPFILPFLGVVN